MTKKKEIKVPEIWNKKQEDMPQVRFKSSLESETIPGYLGFISFILKDPDTHEMEHALITINLDNDNGEELICDLEIQINNIDIPIKTYPVIINHVVPMLLANLTDLVALLDELNFNNTCYDSLKPQMETFLIIQNAILKVCHMCMYINQGNNEKAKEITFQDFNYAKLYQMRLWYTFCDITSILSKLES